MAGVSIDEAKAMLDAWYSDRPEVRAWQAATIDEAHRKEWTRTLMGRYRLLKDIKTAPRMRLAGMERQAINTPIQGGAADVMTLAMLKIHRSPRLKELGYRLLLQIHDEVSANGRQPHMPAPALTRPPQPAPMHAQSRPLTCASPCASASACACAGHPRGTGRACRGRQRRGGRVHGRPL